MAAQFIRIRCQACGAEVDKVEYDPDAANPQVEAVKAALGLDDAAAWQMVRDHNPGAAFTPQEEAEALAGHIVARDVPDRDSFTYACPNGCTEAGLEAVQ